MAVPAARALVKIEDTRSPDVTVKVTAYQWKWRYEYLDEGVSFFSTLDRKSNEIRQMIVDRASTDEIKKVAVADQMFTLRRDGLEKFKMGITSLEEVLRETSAH